MGGGTSCNMYKTRILDVERLRAGGGVGGDRREDISVWVGICCH